LHTAVQNPFREILVGLDLSDQTDAVVSTAAYLIESLKAQAEFVTVVNVPTSTVGNEADGVPASQAEIRLRDELLDHLHRVFSDEADGLIVKVLHGDPAERISEYADYRKCDLIIIGSRRESALRKTILGSVSRSVTMRSNISVLIVKK
jgi:nucleotide-binding universal stress UspA family protein